MRKCLTYPKTSVRLKRSPILENVKLKNLQGGYYAKPAEKNRRREKN